MWNLPKINCNVINSNEEINVTWGSLHKISDVYKNMLGWGVKNNCVMSGKCNLSVKKHYPKKNCDKCIDCIYKQS